MKKNHKLGINELSLETPAEILVGCKLTRPEDTHGNLEAEAVQTISKSHGSQKVSTEMGIFTLRHHKY